MNKIIFTLAIVLIWSALFYVHSEAKERAKVTIKIATIAPRRSNILNIVEELRAKVKEITDNEVDFKIYADGIQGDDGDVLRKIRLKQLHGGLFTGFGLGRIAPAARVTEIPFTFRNCEEVSYVRAELEDTMNKFFEDQGYVVLGWHDIGFVYMFSKAPITSIEILRKQKCWVWGDDPMMIAAYRALGVSPIPLSVSDVLTSLSTKLIDNAIITPFGAVAFRWHTKFRYMTDLPGANGVGALVVTKEIWDKISHKSQKRIKEIAKVKLATLTKVSMEADEKSIGVLKNAGIKIVPFMDSETGHKYIMEMGKKAGESVVGKLYSRELLERTLSLLDEYRENHPDSTYLRIR